MKQNKTLLIAFCLILIGCARDESGLWKSHWGKTLTQSKSANRVPAQARRSSNRKPTPKPIPKPTPKPACFMDRFQEPTLRAEIQQMESQYANGRRGSYQHGSMFFQDLPQATIDALRTNYRISESDPKRTWTAVDEKQAGCKDWSCFINVLYEKPTHEGLVQYWYFLKTGYPMAATDAYSWTDNNGQQILKQPGYKLEQYLFNAREWKAYWLQGSLLPRSMTHLPSLSIIQRLPHGFVPEPWQKRGVCGWARGNYAEGEILLSDPCLYLYDAAGDSSSFFFHSTTHEIAHRFSSSSLETFGGRFRLPFHEDPEFMALSGWKIEQLAKADGSIKQAWNHLGDEAEWQSGYAMTSPAEDFAEMMGLYRTSPEELFSKAPKKYFYAKRKFFDSQGFTTSDRKVAYIQSAKTGLIETLQEWVSPCVEGASVNEPVNTLQSLVKQIEIDLPIDSNVKSCLQKQVLNQIVVQFDRIRYDEPEGCRVLEGQDFQLIPQVLKIALPELNEYFQSSERLTDLMTGMLEFREAITQEFDGRSLILGCARQSDVQGCYETKASSEFDRLYQKFKIKLSVSQVDLSKIEKRRFLSQNSFSKVQEQVLRFYESFFTQHETDIQSNIDNLWEQCLKASPRANTDVLLTPYQPGAHYVAPAVMQCLNERIPDRFSMLRALATSKEGVSIFSDDAKRWIDEKILLPKFKMKIDSLVVSEQKREWAEIESQKKNIVQKSYQTMIAEQDWRNTSYFDHPDCLKAAADVLKAHLKMNQYRFVAFETFSKEWTSLVCDEVGPYIRANPIRPMPVRSVSQPRVDSAPSIDDKKSLDRVWSLLTPLIVKAAEPEFERCYSRMYFTARMKRNCVLNNWDSIVERGLEAWSKTNEVQNFIGTQATDVQKVRKAARARVEDESQEIGDAIMDRFYE